MDADRKRYRLLATPGINVRDEILIFQRIDRVAVLRDKYRDLNEGTSCALKPADAEVSITGGGAEKLDRKYLPMGMVS